ncbi:hypothetical protein ACVI1L_000701 [Bradyrhizobium sp. USDA 4516]
MAGRWQRKCGERHSHGDGNQEGPFFGHRVAHCTGNTSKGYFLFDTDADRQIFWYAPGSAPCGCSKAHMLCHRAGGTRLYLLITDGVPCVDAA